MLGLLIDCEEDRVLRAVLVGMLREHDRQLSAVRFGEGDHRSATPRNSLAQAGERQLHRLVGSEDLRNLHIGQIRSQLGTRLTEELAVNHGDRRKNRRR